MEGEAKSCPEQPVSSRRGAGALLEAMRIPHWVKNALVVAPIVFARQYTSASAWAACLQEVAAFCLLSSSVYLINDICDRESDRAHPFKRYRPIPSGRLSVVAAGIAAGVLMLAGLGVSVLVAWNIRRFEGADLPLFGAGPVVWAAGYFVLTLVYSFWLRHRVIIDVIVLSLGFVLRAMGGAAAIAVPISPWLVVCTFTLCLLIVLTKRRSEIIDLPKDVAIASRRTSRSYTEYDLDHMITVSMAVAIMTYSLYCLAPRTIEHVGSAHMIWTIPVVVYGMFRYNRVTRCALGSDPIRVLLRDRYMWLVLVLYIVLAVLILQFGRTEELQAILK